MTATRRGPFIEAHSTVATSRVEEFDGSFRPRGAPEDDVEVETGWNVGGAFGTWRKWRGGASWTRRDAPPERAEDEVEPWLRSACRAIGCVLLGAPIGAWRAIRWLSDERGAAAEREMHRTVPRAAVGYHLGLHDHALLHGIVSNHRAERSLHLRRVRFRCATGGALVVGGAFGWWWVARHVGALGRYALLGALVLGAVCGAHRIGAAWLARRASGDEWDGIAPRMPAPLNMPDAPRESVPRYRPTTNLELLQAVRAVFLSREDKLTTAEILERMQNGSPDFGNLTVNSLGTRLSGIVGPSVQVNWFDEQAGKRRNGNGFELSAIISALAARAEAPPQ
jgi:hypothetical protein